MSQNHPSKGKEKRNESQRRKRTLWESMISMAFSDGKKRNHPAICSPQMAVCGPQMPLSGHPARSRRSF